MKAPPNPLEVVSLFDPVLAVADSGAAFKWVTRTRSMDHPPPKVVVRRTGGNRSSPVPFGVRQGWVS